MKIYLKDIKSGDVLIHRDSEGNVFCSRCFLYVSIVGNTIFTIESIVAHGKSHLMQQKYPIHDFFPHSDMELIRLDPESDSATIQSGDDNA